MEWNGYHGNQIQPNFIMLLNKLSPILWVTAGEIWTMWAYTYSLSVIKHKCTQNYVSFSQTIQPWAVGCLETI